MLCTILQPPVPCPGNFTGVSRKFTHENHRKNPSMWEIIHIHANSRESFSYSQVSPRKYPAMELGLLSTP